MRYRSREIIGSEEKNGDIRELNPARATSAGYCYPGIRQQGLPHLEGKNGSRSPISRRYFTVTKCTIKRENAETGPPGEVRRRYEFPEFVPSIVYYSK